VRHTPVFLAAALVVGLSAVLVACASGPRGAEAARTSTSMTSMTTTQPPTTAPAPTPTAADPTTRATRTKAAPAPRPTRPRTPSTSALTSLRGNTRNAIAFAPLSNPSAVTIEGSVPSSRAWSTSKVLVVAAFLDTVAGGNPNRLTTQQRSWVTQALTASDMASVLALRDRIPGSPGAAITRVLRSVGDTRTVAPDRSQGSMQWSIREQVRFMAALHSGRVVSPASSAYLLRTMHPIAAHRWGLGTIGASSFKGGWLRADTETRQMGIVDGYAVAIITAGDGPAVVQTDGDSAHVRQMNRLAALLKVRLGQQ
jgi:hypothetical protein